MEESFGTSASVPWVGLGWNLDVGSILRTDSDHYYLRLNGISDELILVEDNGDTKFYKTKSETFLQIRRDLGNFSRWVITDTRGTVYKFGWDYENKHSAQKRLTWYDTCDIDPIDWVWYKWDLDNETDVTGNSLSVSYEIDTGSYGNPCSTYDRSSYPRNITYSSTDTGGAKRRVELNSSGRQYDWYNAGDTSETRKLDSVKMYTTVDGSEQLVREYRFDYSYATFNLGNYLILNSVTPYGNQGQALPSLTFSYVNHSVSLNCSDPVESVSRARLSKIENGWWNPRWAKREVLTITNQLTATLPASYTVRLALAGPSASYIYTQSLASGNDLRLLYWDGKAYKDLDRDLVAFSASAIELRVRMQAAIPASGQLCPAAHDTVRTAH